MIREAAEQDCAALGVVYCLSWKEGYKSIIAAAFLDALTAENCAPESINPRNNLVAEENGSIVGLVNYGKAGDDLSPKAGELKAIYVMPAFWGKGIGCALFTAALEKMKEQGCGSFCLWVLKDNSRARAFYEKMGMKNTGVQKHISIGGEDLKEIRYELIFA